MANLPTEDLDHVIENTSGIWEALAGNRLFIAGGTGFVGKWLLESLLWANRRLRLGISATVLTRDPVANRHLARDETITLLAGNLLDFHFPEGEFPFVIHAAIDLEGQGTERLLKFASQHGTRRLLFTSSGAVYGPQPTDLTHIPEDHRSDPVSPYGRAKHASESLCAAYARQCGFDALIARMFAFVGPHLPLDLNFAAGNFIRDALSGGPIRVQDDGTPYRSYLYSADLAVWLWTILVRGESARPYNVGSGDAVTIAELARIVADGKSSIEIAEKAVPGCPAPRYVPCVERANRELNLRPIIALDDAVRRTCNWLKTQYT